MLKQVIVSVMLFVGPALGAQEGSLNSGGAPANNAKALPTSPDLIDAVRSGNYSLLRALLNKKIDPNTAEVDGSTGLHWAADRGDLEALKLLIGAGADPNVANQFGVTPLQLAAKCADSGLVKVLLDKGADPGRPAPDGATPLMIASRAGRTETVELLLQRGADANAKEKTKDQTALMFAVYENHLETARRVTDSRC